MVINHNMSAMFANRQLGVTGLSLNKDMEKLSSGERINRAGDDASGLAVSEKMQKCVNVLQGYIYTFLPETPDSCFYEVDRVITLLH